MMTSYTDAAGRNTRAFGTNLKSWIPFATGVDIGGLTLAPGLYKFDSSTTLLYKTRPSLSVVVQAMSGFFQCGADLEVASGVHIILAGGANPINIFWQVATKAVLGHDLRLQRNHMAGTSITMKPAAR